jgi:hypothetical protein
LLGLKHSKNFGHTVFVTHHIVNVFCLQIRVFSLAIPLASTSFASSTNAQVNSNEPNLVHSVSEVCVAQSNNIISLQLANLIVLVCPFNIHRWSFGTL